MSLYVYVYITVLVWHSQDSWSIPEVSQWPLGTSYPYGPMLQPSTSPRMDEPRGVFKLHMPWKEYLHILLGKNMFLVGGWALPLLPIRKMIELKSVGMMTFPTEWKNKNVPNHQPVFTFHAFPAFSSGQAILTFSRWVWPHIFIDRCSESFDAGFPLHVHTVPHTA